jgi:hypothetical protein
VCWHYVGLGEMGYSHVLASVGVPTLTVSMPIMIPIICLVPCADRLARQRIRQQNQWAKAVIGADDIPQLIDEHVRVAGGGAGVGLPD